MCVKEKGGHMALLAYSLGQGFVPARHLPAMPARQCQALAGGLRNARRAGRRLRGVSEFSRSDPDPPGTGRNSEAGGNDARTREDDGVYSFSLVI